MRKLLLSLLLFSTAFGIMAQQRTITGVVSANGETIPGASVVVKGTTRGAAADFDGKFEISVSNGETLVVSSLGMQPQEVKISASTTTLNVTLKEDEAATKLEEFVVTSYGIVRKSDKTGALSKVSEDQLRKAGPTTSIDQALQGRVSGVQVNASSGQPGSATSVRIRGTSSFGNNQPLYVVDGMPVGNGEQGGGSNPLASINPADIVSMEILKDASATAIYGSRASNGVVMITTRKGNDSGISKISYEGGFMVSQVAKKMDMMNLREYAAYVTDPFAGPGLNVGQNDMAELRVDPSLLGKGSDWQDALLRIATGHSHQLSVTGGNKETQFAISLGYQDQNGVMIGTDFQRFSGRVNVENQTKSWLKTGINLAYTRILQSKQPGFDDLNSNAARTITVNLDESPLMQALLTTPNTQIHDVNGGYYEAKPAEASAVKYNAIMRVKDSPIYVTNNNVSGSMFANIEFIKNLNWRNEFGVDYTGSEDKKYLPLSPATPTNKLDGWSRNNFYWRYASTLNYFKQIKKNAITAMVGFEAWESSWEGLHTVKSNYPTDVAIDPDYQNWNLGGSPEIGGYKGSQAMLSYLGRLNYSYDNRYLLTATGRFDGSSNFAPEKRWGFFPSFAFAWTVDQESFIKDNEKASNLISQLRLRLGYGETGNAGNVMAYRSTFRPYATFEGEGASALLDRWTNEDLIWETNWQANVGLDYGMLNSRITLTVDGFYKQNDNLLVLANPGLSLATDKDGLYTTPPQINLGSIRNTGFEISLNTVNIDNQDRKFQWTTDFSFSYVRNKVVKLDEDRIGYRNFRSGSRAISRTAEGHAPGMFWGYKVNGVIEEEWQLDPERGGAKRENGAQVGDFNFVDINQDGVIDANDKTWIGDPNPDFTGGLGNTFTYGNWSLTVFLMGSYGNDVYNLLRSKLEGQESANINQLTSVKDFARVDTRIVGQDADGKDITEKFVVNSGTKIPRPNTSGVINLNEASDHFVEDGSFLRIQNISLSYLFPKRWTEKISINDLRLSANVQNVYTFSKYTGYNPEVANSDVTIQGIDAGSYPVPRTYTMNLSFNF
ncbi:MAG: TonB-dependent receptor [Prevotellaceae bacterium]|jgi:TonB-linked SusC/RagA family outer membrane protein|nr:TonB-dependent receptor [Prevotellaceae bacterium]